jgi:hypothetical protein
MWASVYATKKVHSKKVQRSGTDEANCSVADGSLRLADGESCAGLTFRNPIDSSGRGWSAQDHEANSCYYPNFVSAHRVGG